MKVKVCFNNEIHRVSKLPGTYKEFTQLLSTIFHAELPKSWTLQYVDADGDNILMTDDKDYEEFKNFDSQDSNAAVKVFVVSAEIFRGAVVPEIKKEEIVEKVENKLDEDYQVIENLEASVKEVKVEEEPKKEEQKPVVEEIVAEVPVDNKVIDVVPEKQEVEEKAEEKVEEKKEVPQEVKEKEEEKVEFNPIQPKEEVQVAEKKETGNKTLIDMADIGKMIENLIQDKMPQISESIKEQFDAQNIPFTESVIIDPRDKILPEEVLKPLRPEIVHYGIKCNGCQATPIVGVRYKCTVCPDYNLCEKCEDLHIHEHNFIKMRQRDLLDVFKPQVLPKPQICPSYPGLNEKDFPKLENKPVVPKKEDKKGDDYFKKLNEKAKKMQKCFPKEDFDLLCVYINEAPEDMTIEELVENYKH